MKYMTKMVIDQSLIMMAMSIDKHLVPGPLEELQKRRFRTINRGKAIMDSSRGLGGWSQKRAIRSPHESRDKNSYV